MFAVFAETRSHQKKAIDFSQLLELTNYRKEEQVVDD